MALRKEQWSGEPDESDEVRAVREAVRANLIQEEHAPVDTSVEHLYVNCTVCMRDVQITRSEEDPDLWLGRCSCSERLKIPQEELNKTIIPRREPGH